MFVMVIDRVRQRVMMVLRILFLVALLIVLSSQFLGLLHSSAAIHQTGLPYPRSLQPGIYNNPSAVVDKVVKYLKDFYAGKV